METLFCFFSIKIDFATIFTGKTFKTCPHFINFLLKLTATRKILRKTFQCFGISPPPPWSTTLISRGNTTILTVPCRLRWARVYKDLCEVELTVYRVMRGIVLVFGILCRCFQLQRIGSNGIRSKGRRSNVLNVPREDILLFENNKMNDQNQLPLEIYQDQWIHLKALNTKRSGYYKNWPSETSWKDWAGTPLRLNHWKIWKNFSKSSKSIVMLLPMWDPHNWSLFFLTQLVQIICPHGWTRWAKGLSLQPEHKS